MPYMKNMGSRPPGAIPYLQRLTECKAFQENAMDWGGWMWFVIDVVAVVILGGAIAYGASMWRHRSTDPEVQRRSDEATRDLYHHQR